VRDAIASFAERVAEKIRQSGQVCGAVQVFIMTDRFNASAAQHSASASATFMNPTADSRAIAGMALRIFQDIWREGLVWRKAGVLLLDLSSARDVVPSLFPDQPVGSDRLMWAMDQIKGRYGRGAIGLGLAVKEAEWRMRQKRVSPHFTTRWKEIPRAQITPYPPRSARQSPPTIDRQ
jgi:DNA polymerase V